MQKGIHLQTKRFTGGAFGVHDVINMCFLQFLAVLSLLAAYVKAFNEEFHPNPNTFSCATARIAGHSVQCCNTSSHVFSTGMHV